MRSSLKNVVVALPVLIAFLSAGGNAEACRYPVTEDLWDDIDGDGIPDGFDTDVEGHGVPNIWDIDFGERRTPVEVDFDLDHDGIPNIFDPDIDGDGYLNSEDPEPFRFNRWPTPLLPMRTRAVLRETPWGIDLWIEHF